MIRHLFEFKGLLSLVLLSLFLQTQPAFAAGSKLVILGTGNETRADTEVNKENAKSDRIAGEPTETIVVTLSNEQVRHLIEALTKQPKQGAAIKAEEKVGGLAGLISVHPLIGKYEGIIYYPYSSKRNYLWIIRHNSSDKNCFTSFLEF